MKQRVYHFNILLDPYSYEALELRRIKLNISKIRDDQKEITKQEYYGGILEREADKIRKETEELNG